MIFNTGEFLGHSAPMNFMSDFAADAIAAQQAAAAAEVQAQATAQAQADAAEQERRRVQLEERTAADEAAAAEAYAAAMRDQAVSMRQGEQERGKAITKAFKEGDEATRTAIATQYQLSPSQVEALKPKLWEKKGFWIAAAAGGGLLLVMALRPSPAPRSFNRR